MSPTDELWVWAQSINTTCDAQNLTSYFGLLVPLQTQLPQTMHVRDSRSATRLLLLQRVVDFSFAPLIALKRAFCDLTLIASRHKDPFPS